MSSAAAALDVKEARPKDAAGRFLPKTEKSAKELFIEAFQAMLQAHIDGKAKHINLPALGKAKKSLEEYDTGKRNPDGTPIRKLRPKLCCELDQHGNVVYGSGPFLPDQVVEKLFEMILPAIEARMEFTITAMAEAYNLPDGKGFIDDRIKIIDFPKGTFLFVPDGMKR